MTGEALEGAAECMRMLHVALTNIFDFCKDFPAAPVGEEELPKVALVARVVAVWQTEDPMRFAQEFQRSLPALCRLPCAEFVVLLPAVQTLDDWHLTPALGGVLEAALWSLEEGEAAGHGPQRACALTMLTEVALDAAAYLPEAFLPPAPELASAIAAAPWLATQVAVATVSSALPRPAIAADAAHPGVMSLTAWSRALWLRGSTSDGCEAARGERWDLATLCGALLTSVPEEAVCAAFVEAPAVWAAVAAGLLAGPPSEEDAATWRLALRLCGFALDRHTALAGALAAEAARIGDPARLVAFVRHTPRHHAVEDEAEPDEWRFADEGAATEVRNFLQSCPSEGGGGQVLVPVFDLSAME